MTNEKPNIVWYGIVFAIGAVVAGAVATWLSSNLVYPTADAEQQWLNEFWSRFQVMFLLSVLIERSVETYLKVSQQNGGERINPRTLAIEKTDASQPAMIAALAISVLVALAGVRIIETLVDLESSTTFFKAAVWRGIDVFVSAGLLAGGADLFHKVAEVISGGLVRLRSEIGGTPLSQSLAKSDSALSVTDSFMAIKTYTIVINRSAAPSEEGTLLFKDGNLTVNAKCWWDKKNRIEPGHYLSCSKTHMQSLGDRAIYLPEAVSTVTGAKEIFLHHGVGPENSLGCIAIETAKFEQIWNHIQPLNGRNVTVDIKD